MSGGGPDVAGSVVPVTGDVVSGAVVGSAGAVVDGAGSVAVGGLVGVDWVGGVVVGANVEDACPLDAVVAPGVVVTATPLDADGSSSPAHAEQAAVATMTSEPTRRRVAMRAVTPFGQSVGVGVPSRSPSPVAVVASSTDDGGTKPSTAENLMRSLPGLSGSSSVSTTMICPAWNSL